MRVSFTRVLFVVDVVVGALKVVLASGTTTGVLTLRGSGFAMLPSIWLLVPFVRDEVVVDTCNVVTVELVEAGRENNTCGGL